MRRREFVGGMAAMTNSSQGQTLDHPRVREAADLIERTVNDGRVRAATLLVGRGGQCFERSFGEANSIETVFLIASITKPMSAAGVMKLVEAGRLGLEDPVAKHLPEFRGGEREKVRVRHLLTHTCGLPDQLPENVELRKRHAPLAEFAARAMKTPLLFPPGTRTSYSSMGVLLASEIACRLTGEGFPQYLEQQVFQPLGMGRTALGLGRFQIGETALSQVEHTEEQYGSDPGAASWNWNSPYWRNLAAPWGGAHSTARDIARLLEYFLRPDGRFLRRETCEAMTINQNRGLNQPYGIGWALQGFGGGCSPRTFGHGGSTGTLCWADPAKELVFVLLTTLPARVSNRLVIRPVSDLVSEVI